MAGLPSALASCRYPPLPPAPEYTCSWPNPCTDGFDEGLHLPDAWPKGSWFEPLANIRSVVQYIHISRVQVVLCAVYRVTLWKEERQKLQSMVSAGKAAARKLVRARILLLADQADDGPGKPDPEIGERKSTGHISSATFC